MRQIEIQSVGSRVCIKNFSTLLWILFVVFCGLLVVPLLLGVQSHNGSAEFHYTVLTLLMGLIVVLGIRFGSVSLRRGRLDLLELPVWYSLWTLLGLTVFGFFDLLNEKHLHPAVGDVSWLAEGLWLPIVGLCGLWVGYKFGWVLPAAFAHSPSAPRRRRTWAVPKVLIIWLLYGVICIERVWRISVIGVAYGVNVTALGELSSLNQWMEYLEEASFLLIAIMALQVFRKRWSSRSLWIMVGIELVFIFLSGFMKQLLWLGLVLYGTMRYAGRRMRIRWGILTTIILAFIILVPITEAYRPLILASVVNTHSLGSLISGVGQAISLSWGQGIGNGFQMLINKVVGRQAGVAEVWGIILHKTPADIPYWGVKRLLLIPFYVIPRVLWPSKPILSHGVDFSIRYLGAPPTTNSSAAFTLFGDLYLSAGWIAVFIGMMILGILAALLYRHLVVQPLSRGQPLLTAFYIATVVWIMDPGTEYIGAIVGTIQRLIAFGILFWLLRGHLKKTRAVPDG